MVEYHGWATLRETPEPEEDGEEERMREIIDDIQKRIGAMDSAGRILGLKVVNAAHLLWLAGNTNHWSADVQEAFDLFRFIAARAPGSYGLLYVWNDESPEHENEFRVWRLAKGTFSEHTDNMLSPCIPVIESPEVAVAPCVPAGGTRAKV